MLLKHPLLDCDLEEAALWYHLKAPLFAERLIDEVQRVMRLVAERPHQFPIRFADVRRARLGGFPHSLFFVIEADAVFVIALIHGARDVRAVLGGRRTPPTEE